MDKFDINSLGIVLALVGAVLAALLGGIGSAIGVGMTGVRQPQASFPKTPRCSVKSLFFSFCRARRASTACSSPSSR